MKKISLIALSLIALFTLPGCGCKKKTTPLKPEVTLGSEKKKKNKTEDKACKSCTKDYKKDGTKKRHAYIELEEADILI